MGCASERFGPEEDSLSVRSLKTGFEVHHVNFVVSTILRYARLSANLTENEFRAISLALKLEDPKDVVQLKVAYASLKGQILYVILMTGVLLSHGTPEEKATALFEIFDPEATGSLDEHMLSALLDQLFTVPIQVLKNLYSTTVYEDMPYFNELEKNVETAKKRAKTLLLDKATAVAKVDFVKRITQYDKGKLVKPAGIRKYLKEQSPVVPKQEPPAKSKEPAPAKSKEQPAAKSKEAV